VSTVAGVRPGDEQNKNGKMRQSLGVLSRVHGTDAEGEESGQNSGYGRVGTAAASRRRRRWRNPTLRRRRRDHARNESGRGWGHSAFHPRCEAFLAIDDAPHGTRTVRAQCLSASAAIGHFRRISKTGAVHTNLRFLVTVTADGAHLSAAKTGWLYSWE